MNYRLLLMVSVFLCLNGASFGDADANEKYYVCSDLLYKNFVLYQSSLEDERKMIEHSHVDLDGLYLDSKEYLKDRGFSGLLFVDDEDIRNHALKSLKTLNAFVLTVKNVHGYYGICKNNIAEFFIDTTNEDMASEIVSFEYSYKNNKWLMRSIKLINYSDILSLYVSDFINKFQKTGSE